jgi:hypothetical protein
MNNCETCFGITYLKGQLQKVLGCPTKELQYAVRDSSWGLISMYIGAVASMLLLLSTLLIVRHQPTVQVILPEDE